MQGNDEWKVSIDRLRAVGFVKIQPIGFYSLETCYEAARKEYMNWVIKSMGVPKSVLGPDACSYASFLI